MRFSGLLLLALLLGVAPAGRAADKPEPLWHKRCAPSADGAPACTVEQFAVAMPQHVVLLHVRFSLVAKGDQARMVVTAPLGVLLPPGLTLSIDGGQAIALPFERCTGQGCEATAMLDESALAKFAGGKTLTVRYAVSETRSEDIPIRLQGFSDALKSLSK